MYKEKSPKKLIGTFLVTQFSVKMLTLHTGHRIIDAFVEKVKKHQTRFADPVRNYKDNNNN